MKNCGIFRIKYANSEKVTVAQNESQPWRFIVAFQILPYPFADQVNKGMALMTSLPTTTADCTKLQKVWNEMEKNERSVPRFYERFYSHNLTKFDGFDPTTKRFV